MFEVLGFPDPESMIREGVGIDERWGRLIAAWLDLSPQGTAAPVPLEAARVMALAAHGGDRRSEEFRGEGNASLKYGTAAHWQARLRRDRPDLAERVEAGELSANAAALEAGFRHKRRPFEIITRLIPKLDAAERAKIMEILEEVDLQHEQRRQSKMALEGAQ
jgi:hypothetical protein